MTIPAIHFPANHNPKLHFAHANGYPPQAYRQFLTELSASFAITAMEARPLWPDSKPQDIRHWGDLRDDLIQFVSATFDGPIVGAGHSVGGMSTLMAALKAPELFSKIIIIEPPFFLPLASLLWHPIVWLGLTAKIQPLIKSARRRKKVFENEATMFENYRAKRVFRQLSDAVLQDYVESMAIPHPEGVTLRFSPLWEERIYARALLKDFETWQQLPDLKVPVLFIQAEHTNAFMPGAVNLVKRKLPGAAIEQIAGATHLVPLEQPLEIAKIIQAWAS